MTPECEVDFLTGYIRSLSEETRDESKGPRYGFDHIIYELGLADGLVPFRLSFFRAGDEELAVPKKEAEHGVDQSFVSRDGKRLVVFVLKDEVLNYRNWIAAGFDSDLRRAVDQDLTAADLALVEEVVITLAYNKDDNEEGLECWEKYVRANATRIGDKAALRFELWNLTTIVNKVHAQLLTPSLLPEDFFRRFTYICWQAGDFVHGSSQWNEVLLPDWREFLDSVVGKQINERNVRLITVALIILRAYGKREAAGQLHPSFETGWLDLLETAVLALWNAATKTDEFAVKKAVFEVWMQYYLVELERYYTTHADLLAADHSLAVGGSTLQEGASTYVAYWHLGRLGILAMATSELQSSADGELNARLVPLLGRVADWITQLLNANPACQRPMLDIHHIEIFLVWRALAVCQRWEDVANWFHSLFERLLYRRLGKAGCRVIDYRNSWDALFEYLATGEEPDAGFGKSSYLILMIMEICLGLPNENGPELAAVIHKQLILGDNGDGGKLPFKEHVELMGWQPPDDWAEKVLIGRVVEGVSLPAHFSGGEAELALPRTLRHFIDSSRTPLKVDKVAGVPGSVFALACIKHVSPLPSEFWRSQLFPKADDEQNPA